MKKSNERSPTLSPKGRRVGVGASGLATSTLEVQRRDLADRSEPAYLNDFNEEIRIEQEAARERKFTLDDLSPRVVSLPKAPVVQVQRKKRRIKVKALTGKSKHTFRMIRFQVAEDPVVKTAPVNKDILATSQRLKKPFFRSLDANQKAISKYLIQDLAPLMLPAMSAIDDAKEVLSEITDLDIDTPLYATLTKFLRLGVEVKLATWVSRYLGLSAEETQTLFHRLEPKDDKKLMPGMQPIHQMLRSQEEGLLLLQKVLAATKKAQQSRS